jgi:hypothetical protein
VVAAADPRVIVLGGGLMTSGLADQLTIVNRERY